MFFFFFEFIHTVIFVTYRGTNFLELVIMPCTFEAVERPRSCTPLANCSRSTSSRSSLQKTLWNGMAKASDDLDDAPMPDAPPEPEVIDMPPAPASAPPMSNYERCITLRLVYRAGPRCLLKKITIIIIPQRLSVLSRVRCPVRPGPRPCFHILTTSPRHPDSDKAFSFFHCDSFKKC